MAAAEVAVFGMSPMRFLKTKDPTERLVMQKVAQAARELTRKLDLERARIQANEIGSLFRK
jgi:hypothetical protein